MMSIGPSPLVKLGPNLIGTAGLLVAAVFIEDILAVSHHVSLSEIHGHAAVPLTAHMFALTALVLAIWPTASGACSAIINKQWNWRLLPVGTIVVGLIAGQVLLTAFGALVLALTFAVVEHVRRTRVRPSAETTASSPSSTTSPD